MLVERFRAVRSFSTTLAEPLREEDCVVQSMPDASPTKWHLAHTTWFFETFVLARVLPRYRVFHPAYGFLFNSYYDAVGNRHPRPERGLLTRPSLDEVRRYREHVDAAMTELLALPDGPTREIQPGVDVAFATRLGLEHEQQHQELLLTDILHAFSRNPLRPAYRDGSHAKGADIDVPAAEGSAGAPAGGPPTDLRWVAFDEGLFSIGRDANDPTFAFDNERPRHRVFLDPFAMGSRLVTNGEYLAFIADGGYAKPELWLADGWNEMRTERWTAPLYWEDEESENERAHGRSHFSLRGVHTLDPHAPVSHVSFYEADAYARWAGARLPTEAEWEVASEGARLAGNFVESGQLEPVAWQRSNRDGETEPGDGPYQMFGDIWEWTQSPYVGYPGFRPWAGALGEYNGKFMCNQMVLRGGSCVTSISHIRASYRNFFPPNARWQFSGIRLARST
ncbi:MAG TPA: ergothioneine biosynthesis protein EgtB [Polyangiaceae bacterium]|nr:ergothioneine biosynthesis protein EgtB [Polyangiaceae bacterium]